MKIDPLHSTRLDGGWGWIVVMGAFLHQLLSNGISYGFGILYVDLMATFQGTSAEIASVASLSYGTFCFIGPMAGALTNKLGCRFVTIFGAFLESFGWFLSAFTPNLEFLYVTFGVLVGVGGGLGYIASTVSVSVYFDSMQPLATSIPPWGESIGTFLFGFLYRVCIDYYGWRGALIIFAGLMLNGVVCGTLLRPFSKKSCFGASENVMSSDSARLHVTGCPEVQNEKTNVHTNISNFQMHPGNEIQLQTHFFASNTNEAVHEQETLLSYPKLYEMNQVCKHSSENDETARLNQIPVSDGTSQENDFSTAHSSEISKVPPLKTGNNIEHRSRIMRIASLLLGTTNLSLFKDVSFVLYCLSTFLYSFGYAIPFVLVPDMAEKNGFTPSEAAWVISDFGLSALCGNIFFGIVSQLCTKRYKHANVKLTSITVMLSGVFLACLPWTFSYAVLLTLGGAYGFFAAPGTVLGTVVVIELVGDDNLADSLGWSGVFSGLGFITGPPVAGWLFDLTKAYVAGFIAAGASLVLSGIVLVPILFSNTTGASLTTTRQCH